MRDEKAGNLIITGQWKAEGSTSKVDERDEERREGVWKGRGRESSPSNLR